MQNHTSQKILTISIILLIAMAIPAFAQTPQAVIRLETNNNATFGSLYEVPIYLDLLSPSINLYNIDLVIAYDPDAMTPIYNPGNLPSYNNCFWRNYEIIIESNPDCSGENCPPAFVRIKLEKGLSYYPCTIDSSLQLISLLFNTHGEIGQFYPLTFFWNECDDNAISLSRTKDTLLVSNDIFDYNDAEVTDNLSFPTYSGSPDDCLTSSVDTLRTRAIDFYNGGVQFVAIDTTMPIRNNIFIEKTHNTQFDSTEQVSITSYISSINDDRQAFGSFEFLIKYDPNVATLNSVSAGQLMIDCGWESFTWADGSNADCGGEPCPDGLVYIKGIADIDNGMAHPSCLADTLGELAVLNFTITDNIDDYQCIYSPIQFMWHDCNNNTIAYDNNADTLFASNDIFDYDQNQRSIRQNSSFPTRYGAPYECLGELQPGKTSVRGVNYYNGGFDLTCTDSIDQRGDINLNGLSNEIADAVLFSNYFLYGTIAFNINVEAQTAASDVNADGIPLTLNDWIYLYRVVIGDALPYPKIPLAEPDTCYIVQNYETKTISMVYPDSLTAIYLIFGDSINPVYDFPPFLGGHNYLDPYTKVFISPELSGPGSYPDSFLIEQGEIFDYTGEGHLLYGEVAFDGISYIPVVILREGSSSCCYNRGNVDGINGPGIPITVSDLTYLVSFIFGDGPEPICMEEGNSDGISEGDLPINISDLTFLVDFLFVGGLYPPSCQ